MSASSFAGCQQFIETLDPKKNTLFDFASNALVIDDEQLGSPLV